MANKIKISARMNNLVSVKELKTNFVGRGEVKGFKFRQIYVTKRGFLYEVSHSGTKYYEVFKKRKNTRFATYSYPSAKSFGIWAWTYKNINEAIKKLNEINNSVNNKKI